MKLNNLICIFLLYTHCVMANEACTPMDICLLLENNNEEHVITCDKVVDYNLITFIKHNDEIEIKLKNESDMFDFIGNYYNESLSIHPYIFGRKLNAIGLKNVMLGKLVIPLYRNDELFPIDDFTNCIDHLKKSY